MSTELIFWTIAPVLFFVFVILGVILDKPVSHNLSKSLEELEKQLKELKVTLEKRRDNKE